MPASDVPGYVLGYRFNNANLSATAFAEQSGYGAPVTSLNGTPTVETVDGHEGVRLDNTWHGQFWHPNSWSGTVLTVSRAERVNSGTLTKQVISFCNDGLSGNTGKMQTVFVGVARNVQMVSDGGDRAGIVDLTDSTIGAAALCHDQIRREGIASSDGSSIESGGTTGTITTHGRENAMRSNAGGAYIGALTGNTGNTTVDTSVILHLFELHFFEGNPIRDSSTELAAFFSELATAYS